MNNKRIFAALGILVVLAMLLTACGAPQATESSASTGSKELTVAGVVFQDDQFMKTMVKGYTDAGAKCGIKVVTANTDNDQAKEAELIQTYIAQGVKGSPSLP